MSNYSSNEKISSLIEKNKFIEDEIKELEDEILETRNSLKDESKYLTIEYLENFLIESKYQLIENYNKIENLKTKNK